MTLDVPTLVLFVGALVFIAHFFEWVFSFTKIPNVLLLMLVGLVLGPWLGILTPDFFGEAAQVGVIIILVIMLFDSGTDLRVDSLKQAWRGTVTLTLLNFVATAAVVGLVVWFLSDLSLLLSVAVGAMVGGISSAIVIPLVDNLKMHEASSTTLLLESALSDVLSIVITIALVEAAAAGSFSVGAITLSILLSFGIASVIGIVTGIIWSLLLQKIRHLQNSMFTTPAFVFILYGLMELIGVSGLITALTFGAMLGNAHLLKRFVHRFPILEVYADPESLSKRERSFFDELVFLLQTFFFVFVGLSITFANPWVIVFGLILTLIMFVLRQPVVQIAVPKKTPIFDASLMAVVVPKGLAAAVLASVPLQLGLEGGEFIQNLVYPIILFSIIVTAVAIVLLQRTELGALHRRMFAGFGYYQAPPDENASNPAVPEVYPQNSDNQSPPQVSG